MVRRSSLIFAASLAVLSTLEPTFGFAAAAPAQHHDEVEKPRFLRREVKRMFVNTTTAGALRGPYPGADLSTELSSLTKSLSITPTETTETAPETTTIPTHSQTPEAGITPSTQSTQSGSSQSSPAAGVLQSQSQSQSQSQVQSQSQSQSPTLSPISNPAPSQETKPTTPTIPITLPIVNSNTEVSITEQTRSLGNTETSFAAISASTKSTDTASNSLPTYSQSPSSQIPSSHSAQQSNSELSAGSSPNQPSVPTIGSTTAAATQTSDVIPQVPSTSPLENSQNTELPPTSQRSVTSVLSESQSGSTPIITEPSIGPQTTLSKASITEPSITPQTATTISPETQSSIVSQPTSIITARTLTSNSQESQPTVLSLPSETYSSLGQQTIPSITPPSISPITKPGTIESSQTNAISPTEDSQIPPVSVTPPSSLTPPISVQKPSSPILSPQSNTNTPGQQTPVSITIPGATQTTGSQEQSPSIVKSSVPAVGNSNQQPFTQPSQTQTIPDVGGLTHSVLEGTSSYPVVNSVVPSITAGVVITPGETLSNNPLSGIDRTTLNPPASTNVAATVNSGTEAPASTNSVLNGIVPTHSTVLGASLSVGLGGSSTNGAQPASSPAPPESASVPPTAITNKPVIISSAGEFSRPATAVQPGASSVGGGLPASQISTSNPLNTENSEGSTPTDSLLYSALSVALHNTVGPGSTMLPNGAIIPTAKSIEGGNTVVSQPGSVNSESALQGGHPSITLSPGSVVSNPLASSPLSQQTEAPSLTLLGGTVVSNPLASNTQLPQSGPLLTTLPGGSIATNSLASNTQLPESGTPITSLPGGVTGLSTLATNSPVTISLGGPISPNPLSSFAPFTSNGIIVSQPASSEMTVTPAIPASVILSDGSVVQNPSATVVPSDVTRSNGQNPTGSPSSGIVTNPFISETASGSTPINTGLSDTLGPSASLIGSISPSEQKSGAPQPTTTGSNGVGVPIPVQSGPSGVTAIDTGSAQSNLPISTGSLDSGSLASNSVNTGVVATGPTTVPSGSVTSGFVASPDSASVPTSGASPSIVGSATDTSGNTVPITAGQVTGSSSLSGGTVIPLSASNPTTSPASGLSISSGEASGSHIPSSGVVVPSASAISSPSGGSISQGTEATGQTGVSQTAATQIAAGQTTAPIGIGAIGSPSSGSQPAPAPVTGTATGPLNTAVSSPAQVTAAINPQQDYPSNGKGPFTQSPTGFDSNTVQSVPTSILAQSTFALSSQSSFSGPTGLPTGVPLVLYPPNGQVKRPDNSELIQIGFLYPLNYDFVWQNPESQQQIFKYLPMGIAWGLQIDIDNVTMQSLRAWDTTQDLHYITTLALAWVPSGQVDSLGLLVHTPTSRFYHTPDNSTNTLLSMINIALPIAADNSTDGGDSTSFGAVPTSTSTMKDGGAPVGGSIGSSNPVRASSVGIAAGVACGAAAYGAAMFFVARRYRKRRQSHVRSPSMFSSPVMSHVGPDAGAGAALMSGGMGDHRSPSPYHDEDARAASRGSGRSASTGRQQISAPVMAENSLGWN